jgi:hypothetical protein
VSSRPRLVGAGALLLALGILIGTATGGTLAAFSKTTANGSDTFGAKRIFPGNRPIPAFDLRDASSGAESNKSDPLSFAGDSLIVTSSANMVTGSNAYLESTMTSHLPPGLAVSAATFKISLASNGGAGSGNGCFWFQVRSGASVIGTHGSYASAVGCSTGSTLATFNTSIPEVSTTTIANGITVRVFAWETGGKKIKVDLATITGSTAYGSFTSYEVTSTDASGAAVTIPWSQASVDAVTYQTTNAFPTAAATTKYLKLTFDPAVPTGSVVSSSTLTLVWRPSAAVSSPGLCYYVDILQGTTPLASHGSSSSAFACNTSGTSFLTSSISLPEVDTPAEANALVAKFYMWGPACGAGCPKGVVDQGLLTVNYYLD